MYVSVVFYSSKQEGYSVQFTYLYKSHLYVTEFDVYFQLLYAISYLKQKLFASLYISFGMSTFTDLHIQYIQRVTPLPL
jgi:hypothetical protein